MTQDQSASRNSIADMLERADNYSALGAIVAEHLEEVLNALRSELRQSEPPHGLLVSIALRLDHGLFLRNEMFGETEEQHQRRIQVALSDARKAWEECTGHGFYRPEREGMYTAMSVQGVSPAQLFQIARPNERPD